MAQQKHVTDSRSHLNYRSVSEIDLEGQWHANVVCIFQQNIENTPIFQVVILYRELK